MFDHLTLSIILSIAALALVDSINPVELLAAIFLFTTKKPVSRFFPYAIGIFFFHLVIGFVFYYSFHFILDLHIFDSHIFDRIIELIGGVILICLGIFMKKKNRVKNKTIVAPSPMSTFLLGIGITASAIPTSAAYYSALGIIANDKLGFDSLGLLLIIYNLIFVLPLFVLLIIYFIFQDKSQAIFEKVRNFITLHLNKILRVIIILIGLYLIVDFSLYVFHAYL